MTSDAIHPLPLSWSIDTTGITGATSSSSYKALPQDCVALAGYAAVESVENFEARVLVKSLPQGKYVVSGTFSAVVHQLTVVNLDPVQTQINEDFTANYWPADRAAELADDSELEVDALIDGRIPIGILLSELFALSIDPYPRAEGEALQIADEAAVKPFAALATLKRTRG